TSGDIHQLREPAARSPMLPKQREYNDPSCHSQRSETSPMSLFHKLRTQKLLSFTMILFTLSLGIVIGTVVSSGVKAARSENVASDATPLVIPNPVQLSNTFSQIAKMASASVVNIS